MDAKITKQRLSGMLSYDWFKIIAFALGLVLIWSLVLTTAATRITSAQDFTIFNHYANGSVSSSFTSFYNSSIENGVFSYEILETTSNDLTLSEEKATTILQTRITTNQGDLIFVPGIKDEDVTSSEDGYEYTYVDTFATNYGDVLFDLDPTNEKGYFAQMDAFLDEYYHGDHENGTLDEAKAEADFRARVVKDKRYKKESQIVQGVSDEIERIKKYKQAYDTFFNEYLDKYVCFTEMELTDETGEVVVKGTYGLNLCPTDADGNLQSSEMDTLKKYAYYWAENEEGESQITAKNMNVMFFDLGVTDGFQFESLLFVNALIDACITANV